MEKSDMVRQQKFISKAALNNMNYINVQYLSALRLAGAGLQRQQSKQGCEFPHPRHFFMLIWEDSEVLPGPLRHLDSPTYLGSSSGLFLVSERVAQAASAASSWPKDSGSTLSSECLTLVLFSNHPKFMTMS